MGADDVGGLVVLMFAPLLLALALGASAESQSEPSNQTLIFFNARMALREGKANETIKLWLLRNAVENREGHVGRFDADFRSVTWAALGSAGLCHDGLPEDGNGGAGLWPIALHNHVAIALAKGEPPPRPSPFDAFDVGRQQRFVSIHDVLASSELKTVVFFRTACLRPDSVLLELNRPESVDYKDRIAIAKVLRALLEHSLKTLDRNKVLTTAPIEARLFDLDLVIVQLLERKARQEGRLIVQKARKIGVADPAAAQELTEAQRYWPAKAPQTKFLKKTMQWPASDWLELEPQRRQFLFMQAASVTDEKQRLEELTFELLDAHLAKGLGDDVEAWIGFLDAAKDPKKQLLITSGERGQALMGLEPSSGFKERSTIALHRGVAAIEKGELQESLRSFGYALAHAEESREPAVVGALARRWLSYVLAQYQTNEEMLRTLRALVPRQEYNAILEELIWRAALRVDQKSFDLVVKNTAKGSNLDARVEKLRLLAQGKPSVLAEQLRKGTEDEPHQTLRFVKQVLENIESEDADVRLANAPMLELIPKIFDSMLSKSGPNKGQQRTAEELVGRTQGILEGLKHFDPSGKATARNFDPSHEVFAGNIRLAPVDALPWPFAKPSPQAPSAFTPLKLIPVEWRTPGSDGLVFGWRLQE